MQIPPPKPRKTNQNQNIVTKVRHWVISLRDAASPTDRARLAEKILASLDSLHTRLDPVEFGRRGGQKTAERGSEYFRNIAAMRKTKAGGRPRKQDE